MNRILIVTSLAACLVSGYMLAAQNGQSGSVAGSAESSAIHQEFARPDTNKDGYIESDEASADAALTQDFATIAKHYKPGMADFSAWEAQHASGNRGMHYCAPAAVSIQHSTTGTPHKPDAGGGYK
jgi:hypothetical protein